MRQTLSLHSSKRVLRTIAYTCICLCLLAAYGAQAGPMKDYLDSKGGCQSNYGAMTFFSSGTPRRGESYFGEEAEDWTDEDIGEWGALYASCLRRWPAEVMSEIRLGEPIVAPPGAIERRVAEATQNLKSSFIDPARAARRQRQAAEEARLHLAQAAEQRRHDELLRQSEQRAAEIKLRQDADIEREKTRRTVLLAQAEQDRQAADRAKRQAAEEAPLVAAAEQDAAKAREARTVGRQSGWNRIASFSNVPERQPDCLI